MNSFKLKCEILAPIHIGPGHEIDPSSYIITNSKLNKISFENFIVSMDDAQRERFEILINKGDLIEIRKYVTENINKDRDIIYYICFP